MKQIKKTAEHSIFQKRSGRYAVRDKQRKWVNGDKKAEILLTEGLIERTEPQPPKPDEAAQEAKTDDSAAPAEGEESAS